MLLDLGAGGGSIEIVGDHTVRGTGGQGRRGGRGGRCFVAEFSEPFKAFGTFHQNQPRLEGARVRRDDSTQPDSRSDSGSYAGSYLQFSTTAGERILVRISSASTLEAAQQQLDTDASGFEEVRRSAQNAWSEN